MTGGVNRRADVCAALSGCASAGARAAWQLCVCVCVRAERACVSGCAYLLAGVCAVWSGHAWAGVLSRRAQACVQR